ncbi:hypothetical protein PSACC_00205 [Paramicrosporidium saccamoebae]|uniref:Transmembrane protein n=1 Tax=Paramicrosporidium saccamoebae TaxID=1246581 RepID=A0A2H9TQE8_9FUNG|nr:hypothetical protein PSACC_00205 [Paramicrosporidium saccamoebae]
MSRNLPATIAFLALGAILVSWPFIMVCWSYYEKGSQAWSSFDGPMIIFLAFHVLAGSCCISVCFVPRMQNFTALMLVVSALAWSVQRLPTVVILIDRWVLVVLCLLGVLALTTSFLVPHGENQDSDLEKSLPAPEPEVAGRPLHVINEETISPKPSEPEKKRSMVETPAPDEATVAETELEPVPIESKK